MPDLIRDGVTGYGYAAGDVAQLRRCVERFTESAGRTMRLGEAARRHVALYTVEAAARGVIEAARSAAAQEVPA